MGRRDKHKKVPIQTDVSALVQQQVHKAIREHMDMFQRSQPSTKSSEGAKSPTHALVVLSAAQNVALTWEKRSRSYWLSCRKIKPEEKPLQAAERDMVEEIGAQSVELMASKDH